MPPTPRAVSRPPRWFRKTARYLGRCAALRQVALQRGGGLRGKWHLALLLPLAAHADPALVAIDIFQIQPHQLADAQPAPVEELEDGAVARRMRALEPIRGHRVDESVRLLGGHHVGQALGGFGRAHQPRRVHGDSPSRERKRNSERTAASLRRMRYRAELAAVQVRPAIRGFQARRIGRAAGGSLSGGVKYSRNWRKSAP